MKIENKDKEILFSKEAREFFGVESKYFTPDIEDIRVGYECETDDSIGRQIWTKCVIDPDELWGIMERSLDGALGVDIRTLYLTQEQIKAEGWEYQQTNKIRYWYEKESPEIGGNWYGYYIYKSQLVWDPEMHLLRISHCFDCTTFEPVFEGECKSINELRIIQKMLRI